VESKVAVATDEKADWQFIRGLDPILPYDLAIETRLIQRLKGYKNDFEEKLQNPKDDPDVSDVDLTPYFVWHRRTTLKY
jgi:hypothetical protein